MSVRILQVFDTLNRGGSETFIMNVYRNIDREKIQFDFLIHTPCKCDYENEILSLGGRIYRLPKFKIYNYFFYCNLLNKFLKDHKEYKVIHGHNFNSASVYLGIAKKNNRITVCHSHTAKNRKGLKGLFKIVNKFFLGKVVDYRFACGYDAGKYLYKNKEFKVINNGIDTEKYIYNYNISQKVRKELNIPAASVVFGHVGRFMTVKNHDFLIDIFKDYYKINKNSFLILIGIGELQENIKHKVLKYNLGNNVMFLNLRNDVHDLFQAMDIFLFPSLYEGLGIALIEAQATGLKCLASDTIPNEGIITDLVTKLPINQGTDIWVNKITENLNYERKDMSNEIIKSGYNINDTVNKLTDFYLNL